MAIELDAVQFISSMGGLSAVGKFRSFIRRTDTALQGWVDGGESLLGIVRRRTGFVAVFCR